MPAVNRGTLFLFFQLFSLQISSAQKLFPGQTCSVSDNDSWKKSPCLMDFFAPSQDLAGFLKVGKEECQVRGCCFDPTSALWCYYPIATENPFLATKTSTIEAPSSTTNMVAETSFSSSVPTVTSLNPVPSTVSSAVSIISSADPMTLTTFPTITISPLSTTLPTAVAFPNDSNKDTAAPSEGLSLFTKIAIIIASILAFLGIVGLIAYCYGKRRRDREIKQINLAAHQPRNLNPRNDMTQVYDDVSISPVSQDPGRRYPPIPPPIRTREVRFADEEIREPPIGHPPGMHPDLHYAGPPSPHNFENYNDGFSSPVEFQPMEYPPLHRPPPQSNFHQPPPMHPHPHQQQHQHQHELPYQRELTRQDYEDMMDFDSQDEFLAPVYMNGQFMGYTKSSATLQD